jgi:GNAT superfamily N-acetyltransferase
MRSRIRISPIPLSSSSALESAGLLVVKFSWGEDYPVTPISEIRAAEFCVGAWVGQMLVGFAAVSRNASPDGLNTGDLWLGYAVVVPKYRNRGIFRRLYRECLSYIKGQSGRIFCCTDNPIMIGFLIRHGWQFHRTTHDDSGAGCIVFEYPRGFAQRGQ